VLNPASHGLTVGGPRPAIPGPVQDVASMLEPALAAGPKRTALVDGHRRYTFAELDVEVNRAANALLSLGVSPGDRVGASTRNHGQLVIAFLASQRIGALWVGINRPLAGPEKKYILEDAGVRVFLGSADMVQQVDGLGLGLTTVVMAPGEDTDAWAALLSDASTERPAFEVDPFAPAAIAYTSGTTGFPKGAVHSQHNLVLLGAVARESGYYTPDMPHGVMLPLTTLNLIALVPLHTLQNGAATVIIDRGKPVELARWVKQEGIAHFTAVPAIYHDLLTHPEVDAAALQTLVQPEMGGANIPPAIRDLYQRRMGKDICVGYGMTEAPTTVTRTRPDATFEPGLVGNALPQYALEIQDEDGAVLPAGEVGEVVVRATDSGPFANAWTPMLGYWNRPEETAKVLRDGAYHTSDLGRLDEDGQLFIMGRAKEMILRGGANVYPAEVERVLHAFDGVSAAAVVGVEDERLGERVAAFVQLDGDAELDEDALRAHCEAQLARYKVPEHFTAVDAMPRNAMGKIVKSQLG